MKIEPSNLAEIWILPAGEYRSRSEYYFARWCDKWHIPFAYEPEGVQLPSRVRFLPDFFLTESNIFVEIKPRLFKGELWKFKHFLKTIPSRYSHVDEFEERYDLPLGWVVEIRNQEPLAVELYDECGMDDFWREGDPKSNGFGICTNCGRPYIKAVGDFSCHHCKYYPGGAQCGDYPSNYFPELLAKSISHYQAEYTKHVTELRRVTELPKSDLSREERFPF